MHKRLLSRLFVSLLGVVIGYLSFPSLGVSASGPQYGCYVASYARGANGHGYAEIRLSFQPGEERMRSFIGEPEHGPDVTFKYKYTSLPFVEFGFDGWPCQEKQGVINCRVECNGGGLALHPLANGDLLVESDWLNIGTANGLDTVLMPPSDNAGFRFRGTHVLRRVTNDRCARPSQSDENRVLFEPGDYHPAVIKLSAQLGKLGFLMAPPALLYTQDMANAIRSFQESVGLPATGNADAKTVRILNIHAVTYGGGC